MSKTLYLVRHAQAEAVGLAMKDFERSLLASGISEASRLGRKIAERGIVIEKIISSDAVRATQTAKFICEQISFPFKDVALNNSIYDSSVRTLLALLNNTDDETDNIMIIGHNPGISYFAEFLIDEHLGTLPTAGMVTINLEVNLWSEVGAGSGELILFECANS